MSSPPAECCSCSLQPTDSAVHRTVIVSTGSAGWAGRFRLCRKHSLHFQTTFGWLKMPIRENSFAIFTKAQRFIAEFLP